jgi:four helix bundle protein
MHRYKELEVWKLSVDMVEEIYKITKNFPENEEFGITSQIRRSAISIPSNIAEGAGKNTNGDFCRYLAIASGSCNELETQLIISARLKYLKDKQHDALIFRINRVQNMLYRLQKSLRNT